MLDGDSSFLREAIRQRSGMFFEQEKDYWLEAKLAELLRARGIASLPDLGRRLREGADAALIDQVVEACVITETSFFRDAAVFAALQREVLPRLIERRSRSRTLSIWCAGVATGQEAYSVAMLLREQAEALRGWSIEITATDISGAAVSYGQGGCYSQLEINRGLPARMMVKHFVQDELCWRVDRSLREIVRFRRLNLVDEWPALPLMDLVLMRNVLIYFDLATRRGILNKLGRLLKPESYLLLGAAETTTALSKDYDAERLGRATVYRLARSPR